jgi:hypothetical protein
LILVEVAEAVTQQMFGMLRFVPWVELEEVPVEVLAQIMEKPLMGRISRDHHEAGQGEQIQVVVEVEEQLVTRTVLTALH